MKKNYAVNSYKSTKVSTANPGNLIVLLYEAAVRNMNESITLLKESDHKKYEEINNKLKKINDILEELISSLNMEAGGEIASRLRSIYLFIFEKVVEANRDKKVGELPECSKMLSDLLSAWKTASEKEYGLGSSKEGSSFSLRG